jgi:glucan phosphoethanolaminetransferase (alkaline phosphatase superfamily)
MSWPDHPLRIELEAHQADMLKKIAFVLGLLASSILTLMQIVGLAFQNYFFRIYQDFGAELPAYTAFFFNTWLLWWMLPVLCVTAVVWAIRRPSGGRAVLALSLSLLGFAAIFVALYRPIFRCCCVVD